MGEDRPRLLFDLATLLSNKRCNIEVVMIDTEAHKAIDVFYVTRDGDKLSPLLQEELKEEIVRVAIQS